MKHRGYNLGHTERSSSSAWVIVPDCGNRYTDAISLDSIDMLLSLEYADAAVQEDVKPEISMEEDLPVDKDMDLNHVHQMSKV